MKKTILALSLSIITGFSFAQKKHHSFNEEEYKTFVEAEEYQTVVEGQDAQFTVLLSKVTNEDIKVTYTVHSGTAKIGKDFTIPKVQSFIIPKGEKQSTIHIPTIQDHFNESDETFTIEVLEGVKIKSKKKLNNTKLIRKRTIVQNTNTNYNTFFVEEHSIQTNPTADEIEVRNMNGILIPNQNLRPSTYLVKALINDQYVTKTIMITQ